MIEILVIITFASSIWFVLLILVLSAIEQLRHCRVLLNFATKNKNSKWGLESKIPVQ